MVWLIPGVAIVLLGTLLLASDDEEKTEKEEMANTNKLFLDFKEKISLSKTQKDKLKSSREAVEKKIREALKAKAGVDFKGFYIQGSQSPTFGTVVLKKDGTYDVDLGVYLSAKPADVTCTTVMKYVHDAIKEHTEGGASHLKKCIRLVYAGDFDIDLPVYYQGADDTTPYIAVKNGDWRKDDPKGTAEWFREKKKGTNGQLVRVIKYLKIWSDKDARGFKMPSGFALTVWAANNFVQHDDRDDKALLDTLKGIQSAIFWGVTCTCPKEPNDNLTDNLDDDQKTKFRNALADFITDAEKAINEKNQLAASKLWQKHLGDRFPDGADEDIEAKEKQLRDLQATIASGAAKLSSTGQIQKDSGVSHQPHRNYGDNG